MDFLDFLSRADFSSRITEKKPGFCETGFFGRVSVNQLTSSETRAASPFSPVRIRIDSSMGRTKILPSPIFPDLAELTMVSITL